MGHTCLRGAPQDDELRLRSARSHRATAVRARPCAPAIARMRRCRWDLHLFRNRVLGNGSIVIIEERHAEAQQQLVDGGLALPNGALELALPLLIRIPHAPGHPISEARTPRLL